MNPSCDTRPTAPLHWQQHGEVVFFTLDAPPVNGLGLAVRQALMQALARAQAEASVRAIVLTGRPDCFCAGADVREFGTPRATTAPLLPDVIAALEASPKPVVAAIGGPCLGGGLELALGCHLRLAHPQARLGLPEVKLGLMPGAGGTQRLPRLLGLELAGRMIVQGEPLTAAELAGTPLLDGWLPQDATGPQEATAWRLSILQALAPLLPKLLAQPPQAVSQRPVPGPAAHWPAGLEALVQASPALRQTAARCCAEALADAATLPFAQGQQRERERFLALLASPESQALREAFAAERAAKKKPAG